MCNSAEASRSSGMDSRLNGSLQYPNKSDIHTTYYRLRSTHTQLRKKIRDLHICPYTLGQPPTPIRNAVNIYTDGSKLNSQTGGGVFSPELDIKVSFPLPDHCSVFQAEVMAIQEAMSYLDSSDHHDTDIFTFSDSQAALKALDSYTANSTTISECRKSQNEMATHLRINLICVPGHHNIEGNCIADELASQGPPTSFAIRTRWVCPWLPVSSTPGRDCTPSPTTTILDSRGQITTTGHCLLGTHARRLELSN